MLHVDMDAFFAAVETLARPALRGQPLVVGGEPGGRGVVATASYEARKFGIGPGMSLAEAYRRCPSAVFLPGDPPKYVYYSIRMLERLRAYSPLVEPFSIDEAFVGLEEVDLQGGREVGARLQADIERALGLTASIGVGPNKLVAKMASRVAKPRGLTMLDQLAFQRHFWPRPAVDLYGVGEKTAAALAALRIRTIGELAQAPPSILARAFGVIGNQLRHMAAGRDETPIIPYYAGVAEKSMGHEHTLARNDADPHRLEALLCRLVEQVARRLRKAQVRGRRLTVKLRFADFKTITRQRTLPTPSDEERTFFPLARDLLHQHSGGKELRLLGFSVADLSGGAPPPTLFASDARHRDMLGVVDQLRDKFGENVFTRAKVMTAAKRLARSAGPEAMDGRLAHRRSLRSRPI
ncbi:MAG TPA: DNA polymerase IV [Candidatus Udaeobacter sp.]|nr:DNA polymerase IV [Candidatus Udaeobacter sp.]